MSETAPLLVTEATETATKEEGQLVESDYRPRERRVVVQLSGRGA